MKPLFIVRDGECLVAAKRNTTLPKPLIQFLAKGHFPGGVNRVAFALCDKDAYELGQGLAVNLETNPESTDNITLRLHDDFQGRPIDLDVTPCMAKKLARELLQKLGN